MSRPVDVMADWANDATCPLDEANRRAETYAAVAELVEAVRKGATMAVDGKSPALYYGPVHADRLRAALAKFGGAK